MATEVNQMATQASGNTSPEAVVKEYKCPKRRGFLLTFNGDDCEDNYKKMRAKFETLKTCDFITACREWNKQGNLHIHMYAHFKNAYSIGDKLRKSCGNPHIDPEQSSPKECINYVRKTGNERNIKKGIKQKTQLLLPDFGVEPHQGTLTIKELREIDNSDDLPDWKQYNVWKQVRSEHKKTKVGEWHKTIDVFFIQGPSGVGKSKKAEEIVVEKGFDEYDLIAHDDKGFWLNTDGTGAAIYDEFRDSQMPAHEFISFIDYNIHNLRVFGGSIKNKYELIVITTVQDIDTIYHNLQDEPRRQWLRRMNVIRWDEESQTFLPPTKLVD